MRFTSERTVDDALLEQAFAVDDVTGILWTPSTTSPSSPAPLILMGQPGGIGLRRMYPRLAARARSAAAHGFASIAIELPGAGDRPALPGTDRARSRLRDAIAAGRRPGPDVIDDLVLPVVDQAVPEWQAILDRALDRPELVDRVGFSGGVIAVGVRLAATDPRIAAAGLFAGSYIPRSTMGEARQVSIPLHVLLQWDDEGNDRGMALDLFDAFASTEKTLYANMGGHTGVPTFAGDDAARFFTRHLAHGAG